MAPSGKRPYVRPRYPCRTCGLRRVSRKHYDRCHVCRDAERSEIRRTRVRPSVCRVCKTRKLTPQRTANRVYICSPCYYRLGGKYTKSRDRVTHRFQQLSWTRKRRLEAHGI